MKIRAVKLAEKTSDNVYEIDSLETLSMLMKSVHWLTYRNAPTLLMDRPEDFFEHTLKNIDQSHDAFDKIDTFIHSEVRKHFHSATQLTISGSYEPEEPEYQAVYYSLKMRRSVGFPEYVGILYVKVLSFEGNFLSIAAPYFGLKGAAEYVKVDCELEIEEYGYVIDVGALMLALSKEAFFCTNHDFPLEVTAKKLFDRYESMLAEDRRNEPFSSFSIQLICPYENDSYAVKLLFDNMTLRQDHKNCIFADGLPSDQQKMCNAPPTLSVIVKKVMKKNGAFSVVYMTESERVFAQTSLSDAAYYLQVR